METSIVEDLKLWWHTIEIDAVWGGVGRIAGENSWKCSVSMVNCSFCDVEWFDVWSEYYIISMLTQTTARQQKADDNDLKWSADIQRLLL